jgi:hypothetical protein
VLLSWGLPSWLFSQELRLIFQVLGFLFSSVALYRAFIGTSGETQRSRKVTIIVLAVLAVVAVMGAYLSGHFSGISRREAYESACDSYGVARDQFYRSIDIDSVGNAAVDLGFTFRAINRDVDYIEQRYSVPHDTVRTVMTWKVAECSNGSKLIVEEKPFSSTTKIQRLKFDPVLRAGDSAKLKNKISWKTPRGFAMTDSAFRSRDQNVESAGMLIRYPSDSVIIKVVFPLGYKPKDLNFAVWYGEGEVTCKREYDEVSQLIPRVLTLDDRVATLIVPYPLVGLTYAIAWRAADAQPFIK